MSPPPDLGVRPRTEAEIVEALRREGPALVALSGGVDSSTVAALAHEALGPQVVAATVVSSAVSPRELETAREVARSIGLRHRWVVAEPLSDDRYRANGADRCYRCRSVETQALRSVGEAERVRQYLDGIHLDDLGDDRPGIRAMELAGFIHPLVWAGWTKSDARRYAQSMGLPNWDRPSNACLASRVARGEPISRELLERIDQAEGVLLDRGFRRVRVRVQGGVVRVEVGHDEVDRLEDALLRAELTDRLQRLGFGSVTYDPVGYLSRERLPVIR